MSRVELCAAMLFWALIASAEAANPGPLFADDAVLDVRIEAPIKVLMDVRPDEAYLKGAFIYTDLDGEEHSVALKLRTRGNYRRDKSHCDFAPVLLNFPKDDVYGTLLEGQNKLKLVTHCRRHEIEFERYLLREYLAYRLFAELSETSYRVRLLRVTYYDPHEDDEFTSYAYVIEDDSAVAKRNGMKKAKARRMSHDDYEPAHENLLHVFQYMIGNTAYSLVASEPDKKCCRNIDLLSATKEAPFVPVPYDFDFSGLVDADYAQPNPRYEIETVRDRYYKGRCKNNGLLPETLDRFREKRQDLFAIIDSVANLDKQAEHAMRPARSYLEEFYAIVEDPGEVQSQLVQHCAQSPEAS